VINRPRYYQRDGKPYTGATDMEILLKWGNDFENIDLKRVAQDKLKNGVFVSTVWLGMDHSWFGGKPLIFETMVFGAGEEEEQERYSTEKEALAGHKRFVEKYRHEQ